MSILSQIGVVVLIAFIILILIRSNKTLEEVSKEGEHFVDEWDLRQQRKAERLIEKEQKKHRIEYNEDGWEDEEEEESEDSWEAEDEEESENSWKDDAWERRYPVENPGTEVVPDSRNDKIISMHAYKNAGVTLIELDEQHHPVRRVKVDQLPFYIGRSTKNQLVLDDLCVARMHCRIVEKEGVFLLQDVGSANKLFVNGRVEDQVVLRDKLTVYIGNVEFQVEMSMARSSQTQLYQNAGEYYYE